MVSDQSWGLNIYRVNQRTGYEDTWTDVRRASASFLAQAGTITGIHDIHRGVVTEVQPTLTLDAPGSRQANGTFTRGNVHPDVGGNVRLGFTNLTLDGTINPDFSQVESDAGLVTINQRFALFYPERRPFFLEGIELFASPNNLVYTRTIANPLAGAKITGKFGSWTVAHLSAVDEMPGCTERLRLAHASPARPRRQFGGRHHRDRSRAGWLVTIACFPPTRDWCSASSTTSRRSSPAVPTRDVAGGPSRTAPLWELEVDRTGRAYGFNYKVTGIDQDFTAGERIRSAHRASRAPRLQSHLGLRGAGRIDRTASRSSAAVQEIWRYQDFLAHAPLEGQVNANFASGCGADGTSTARSATRFTRFEPTEYTGYAVSGPYGPVPMHLREGVFDAVNGSLSLAPPCTRSGTPS